MDDSKILEQAAEYFVRLHRETAAQRNEREQWLAADPRHARAYEETQRISEHVGQFRMDATWEELVDKDLALLQWSRRRRSSRVWMAAAALLLLAVSASLTMWLIAPSPPPVRYATTIGERHTETLPDGSEVILNTNSVLDTRYTHSRRDVALRQGEAQFEVTHDGRPFVVSTNLGTITALGTRFQVRREANADVVTLLSGKVEVVQGKERHILHPNEQARLAADAGMAVRTIDPAQVTGWLDGWLRFRAVPLSEVVAEANRYSARKLRLGDERLASLKVSGNFRSGDSAFLAAGVAQILPVRVDDRSIDIVLLPK